MLTALRVVGSSLRLTRLIVDDDLGQWLVKDHVDAAMDRYERTHATEPWWWKYRSGLDCPYCIGFWLCLVVLVGERAVGRNPVWRIVTGALALNELTAALYKLDNASTPDDDEEEEEDQ